MDKLKRQLAEAEAALEARKKPPEETGPRVAGEGLVIDEWVSNYSLRPILSDTVDFVTHTNASFLSLISLSIIKNYENLIF